MNLYTPRGWLQSRTVGGELTQFDYDAVGQLIKLTRPDAREPGSGLAMTHFNRCKTKEDVAMQDLTPLFGHGGVEGGL